MTVKVEFVALNLFSLSLHCDLINYNNLLQGVGNNDEIPETYMKSENITLESRVTIDCNDSKIFSSEWSIQAGFYYNESVPLNIDTKKLKLLFKSSTFQYGMYRFCSKVVMMIDDRFQREKCGFVEIVASPLVADIVGGDKLTIPFENPVSLWLF